MQCMSTTHMFEGLPNRLFAPLCLKWGPLLSGKVNPELWLLFTTALPLQERRFGTVQASPQCLTAWDNL
jgi:hypothetical protein